MRKVNRNRTGNKSRLYYIFGIVAICAFVSIGIGYSILTSTVRVDGTASITSTWKIVFTKAVENTMNEATTTSGPSITAGTTLDIGVELNKKGSQAIYDVTVQNQGTIDAVVKEIRLNDGEPTDLKVYISGLYKGFALKAGESKQFQVIAEWSASAPESSETEKNVNVSVDFEQETEGSEKPELSMPTYTVDYPNEVWTKEKNVTMTYPEGEDLLYQYSTDGGKTWLIAPSRVYVLKFTTEGTLYIRVSDGVSVLTTPLITIDKIDTTAPDVQVNGNDSEWTTSKTLTINASDKESGLVTNPYSWDGGKTWTSVKEKEFTSNQTVNIWVKDNVGNINKQSITINKIDNQAPTNVTLKEGSITSSSISVTASATQNGGGIKGYQFSINNGVWSSEQTSATKTFTGLTKNTSYTIKVRVIANNGKYTDSSNITIKTNDITVPTYSVVDDGPNFTKEVTINYPDVKTINLVYEYSTDGGKSWMAIGGTTTTITFTEDGSVIARVRDTGNNNNTVTASTLTIQFPINMLIDGLKLGNLKNIEFVNGIAPDGTEFIDVSKEQNESIQLWTDTSGKSYIGSKKKIYGNTDSSWLFSSFETYLLEAITFNDYFDTSKVTNMSYMFAGLQRLTSLDISNWDTSNVTNMSSMFINCNSLKQISGLNNWNTSQVTNMTYMFKENIQLTSLELSNWNTSEVTDMSNMFVGSSNLTSVGNLSNWKTSKVTNMSSMFDSASSLTSVGNLSNWNTSQVTNMSSMFARTNLTSVGNLSNWDTSKVTNMSSMFYRTSIEQLTLSNWDTSQVTNMSKMFSDSRRLSKLDTSGWNTSKVTNMNSMFSATPSLTDLDLSHWNTSNVTDMNHMFYFMIGLTNLNVSNWNTSKVTDMSYTFAGLQRLTSLDISNWDTSKVTKSTDMFKSSNVLSRIKVGTKVGTNALSKLPQQSSSNIPGADGKWYSETTGTGYLPSNIPGNKADTYTAISPKADFTTDSWDKIVSNIRAGKSSVYEVGDTKEVTLSGTYAGTYTLRLANNSTPSECSNSNFSQTACGFVVEFEDIITNKIINSSDTNKDGWPGSELYQKLNPKNGDTTNSVIYNALPEDLKQVIVDTKVISSHGKNDTTNFTSIDKLYLLATKEIWGKDGTSNIINNDTSDNQTRQLDYYKSIGITTNNYSGAIKQYQSSSKFWWTRSANSRYSHYFYNVNSIGGWSSFAADGTSGVAPAFRIG